MWYSLYTKWNHIGFKYIYPETNSSVTDNIYRLVGTVSAVFSFVILCSRSVWRAFLCITPHVIWQSWTQKTNLNISICSISVHQLSSRLEIKQQVMLTTWQPQSSVITSKVTSAQAAGEIQIHLLLNPQKLFCLHRSALQQALLPQAPVCTITLKSGS